MEVDVENKILIGLHGLARSGKDTLGGYLSDSASRQGVKLKTYALAAPIKDMMCALLGWDDRHRDGELKEQEVEFELNYSAFIESWQSYQMTTLFRVSMDGLDFDEMLIILGLDKCNVTSPRKVFQLFGTEYGREKIHKDVWLKLAEAELNKPTNHGLIITDVRFENEAKWIRHNDGWVVHVRRNGQDKPEVRNHVSEAGISTDLINYTTIECQDLNELFIESMRIEQIVVQDSIGQAMKIVRDFELTKAALGESNG